MAYASVYSEFLRQSKPFAFYLTGPEEGLSRVDDVILETNPATDELVLGHSDPCNLRPSG